MQKEILLEKSKEELLKIIAKPFDYQKKFVKLAYEVAREKQYIEKSAKTPFPIDEKELGKLLFEDTKTNFFDKSVKFGIIFFGILAIGMFVLGFATKKEEETSLGFIFSVIALSPLLFILLFRVINLNRAVDGIFIKEKGIKFIKKSEQNLFFLEEIGNIEIHVNKKAGAVGLIVVRTKWHEEFRIISTKMPQLSQLLTTIFKQKVKINVIR